MSNSPRKIPANAMTETQAGSNRVLLQFPPRYLHDGPPTPVPILAETSVPATAALRFRNTLRRIALPRPQQLCVINPHHEERPSRIAFFEREQKRPVEMEFLRAAIRWTHVRA